MNDLKPREWVVSQDICDRVSFFILEGPKMSFSEEVRVREVLPGRTDTDRLEWILEKELRVIEDYRGKFYMRFPKGTSVNHLSFFDTKREAIDDAMDKDKK